MLLEIAPKARENFHILQHMLGEKYQQFAAAARRKIFRKPPNLPEITKIPPFRKSSKYAKGGIFGRLSTDWAPSRWCHVPLVFGVQGVVIMQSSRT